MKTITIFILLFAFTVNAETRLIVPFYTTHIGVDYYNDSGIDRPLNEDNYGLGIESVFRGILYSAAYFDENSYYNHSVYLSASKEIHLYKNTVASYGLAVASGYEYISDSGIALTPVFSIKYKSIRVATSYPFSALLHPSNIEPADFVNIQYIHEF